MAHSAIEGKTILLVDDEMEIRRTYQMLLALDDHQVTEAANGAEALELFARSHFDLVITDREMPVMKGDELAIKIKEFVPEQPILMITAYPIEIGPRNPVDALLNKPFRLEELRRIIAELLSSPLIYPAETMVKPQQAGISMNIFGHHW